MTVFLLWIIAFVLIGYLANKRWESGVSQGLDKMLPDVLKTHGENRYVWIGALAILGATTLVRPVDILLVVILLAIIGLIVMKLANWASNKVTH
ncbi:MULTISPECIES: hypothetical protein [unclassified Halomonas]|uniref:hypothetical protein n=1 Tax=unclassified Halomonas TaxID=2609666 RepID=UPI000990356E|nr:MULTISPECIES: hypothetical protein [unclassified Halomonas]AQU81726.1 hypothetical protein B2G49_03355 [Halomonas sp. 'Soap Lake \